MVNYPVGDFVIQIKNAALAGKTQVELPTTKLVYAVAKALKKEGFLQEVSKKGEKLTVKLTYKRKRPILLDLRVISRPGLRTYISADELSEKKGVSVFIVSTSKGVMSASDAVKKRVGGEVIVELW